MKQSRVPRRVFVLIPELLEAGGLEQSSTLIALELVRLGVEVFTFTKNWVPASNPYVSRLKQGGGRFFCLPRLLDRLADIDLVYQQATLTVLLAGTLPLLVPVAAVDALLRRRSFIRSLQGGWGRARGWLGIWIVRDFRADLNFLLVSFFRHLFPPDVIQVRRADFGRAISWGRRWNLPLVFAEHGLPNVQVSTWQLLRKYINDATLIIAVSEASKIALQKECGATKAIVVIHNPVERPNGHMRMEETRDHTGLLTVTCISRLVPLKGVEVLLQAFACLEKRHPDLNLMIAGDGPLKGELIRLAAQLDIDGRVRFMGAFPPDELPEIMRKTDIVVLPSFTEGLPRSVLEAMAYGKPIVATAVGGIPELVAHGISGLLVSPGDPSQLAEALSALASDADLRFRMSQASLERYEEGDFTPAHAARATLAVYNRALQLHQGAYEA